jgi:hypothetical protein
MQTVKIEVTVQHVSENPRHGAFIAVSYLKKGEEKAEPGLRGARMQN